MSSEGAKTNCSVLIQTTNSGGQGGEAPLGCRAVVMSKLDIQNQRGIGQVASRESGEQEALGQITVRGFAPYQPQSLSRGSGQSEVRRTRQ